MNPSIRDIAIGTFLPMLRNLSELFDKAAQQAANKKIDLATLPNVRLAPDMYPLTRQVQIACDLAKSATAHLTGREPPRHEDNERTLDELKARIAKTIAYVESVRPEDFTGAETRVVRFPLMEDYVYQSNGFEYLRDWVLPHFYFHIVTAYDILRHSGFEIGKRDYMTGIAGNHIRIEPKAGAA
jgi:hypothetical protein